MIRPWEVVSSEGLTLVLSWMDSSLQRADSHREISKGRAGQAQLPLLCAPMWFWTPPSPQVPPQVSILTWGQPQAGKGSLYSWIKNKWRTNLGSLTWKHAKCSHLAVIFDYSFKAYHLCFTSKQVVAQRNKNRFYGAQMWPGSLRKATYELLKQLYGVWLNSHTCRLHKHGGNGHYVL